MTTKIKLKGLFSDIIKKLKPVEKSNPELNLFGVLFELSSCHVIPLEEIHKTLAKIKSFYMDFNEFRVTEIDDICKDFNMPDRADDLLTFTECLDNLFEKNGKVDLFDVSKYDDQKISDLFNKLANYTNGNCYSYYLTRLGKEAPYVFNENQLRILKRLKIAEEAEDLETVKKKVEKVFPAEKGVSFFMACQVHANEFCREENPSCSRCPFLNDCDFGKNVVKERDEKQKEREIVKQKALEEEQRKIENEKKKAKVSGKKKDKNDNGETVDEVMAEDGSIVPVLSKREQKKLLRLKEAEEKAALKVAAKLAKKKLKEDARAAQIAANALKAEEARNLKKAKAEEALKLKEPKKDSSKIAVKETTKELVKENTKEKKKEKVKVVAKEVGREVAKQVAKGGVSKDSSKEAVKQTGKEATKVSAKDMAKETSKKPIKEQGKDKKLPEKVSTTKGVATPEVHKTVQSPVPSNVSKKSKKESMVPSEAVTTIVDSVKSTTKKKDKIEVPVVGKAETPDNKVKSKKGVSVVEVEAPIAQTASKKAEKGKADIKPAKKQLEPKKVQNTSINKKGKENKKEIKLEKQVKKMPKEKSKPVVSSKKEIVTAPKTGKTKVVAKPKTVATKAFAVKTTKKKEVKPPNKKKPVKKVEIKKKK